MNTLEGTIEQIGEGVIVNCYFSVGYVLNPEYIKEDNKPLLASELLNILDDVKTDLIHYNFDIEFEAAEAKLLPICAPNSNGKIPIYYYYEDTDEVVGELYFGNSIFIPDGNIQEGKMRLLQSIKEQAKVAYMYFKDNDYEWVEE